MVVKSIREENDRSKPWLLTVFARTSPLAWGLLARAGLLGRTGLLPRVLSRVRSPSVSLNAAHGNRHYWQCVLALSVRVRVRVCVYVLGGCVCVCVCVCVICTTFEVDPYAAMGWQVHSAQSVVASLRL